MTAHHPHPHHEHPHSDGPGHAHAHGHGHVHVHTTDSRRLAWALAITAAFMVVEVVGGWLAGSLALLADAGHMLADVAALLLAWIAARLVERPSDPRRTYGHHRAQVLAAFINALALFVVVIWILAEAVQRFASPQPIMGPAMLGIAIAGLAANLIVYFVLRTDDEANLNVGAARLHVIGDMLGSIGAAGAAIVILLTGWTPIDPILSVMMAVLIVRGAWSLLRESTRILMEAAPDSVDVVALRSRLVSDVPGVRDVHDVHCWSLTSGQTMVTLHLAIGNGAQAETVLEQAKRVLAREFAVSHSALQVEQGACPDEACRL